jgi:RimJ/RimL family protein N-acetyltransferase
MLTKAGRGPWGFAAAKQARDMIGAERLWARIDPANKPLALFAMKAGFREVERRTLYQGETPHEWRIFEWRKECPLQ